jgi:peptide/nickel transport system permease protein
MLVLVLALHLRWLPATGYVSPFDSASDALRHMLLPTLTLGASAVAEVTRQLRSSLGETLAADFVKTARAKGLAEGRVVAKHALRPALIPVVTVAGLTISGLGRLNLESVLNRDFPMLQGAVLVTVLAVIVVNLLSDLLYGLIDPRIRYG